MADKKNIISDLKAGRLPFPMAWLSDHPGKVETILNSLSVVDQARCVLQMRGKQQQDLILLSSQAPAVVRALPVEEVYQMVKEIGEENALPVLSIISTSQLQYIFDVEWWEGHKFLPKSAMAWLDLMDQANDQQILAWFGTEDFDQKVMVLQSLIKVFINEDSPEDHEGVEGLLHFSLDGVHEIFLKVPEAEPILKKLFKVLFSEYQKLYFALMEGVISYMVTPTVETSYRWLLSRNEEKGIPSFEEAQGVYSLLDPEDLKLGIPSLNDFSGGKSSQALAPSYLLADVDPATFLGQCLAMLKNPGRFDTLCWEIVYLANKVMVADRRHLANLEHRRETMGKVLGYINIGLELGASGDIAKGEKILSQTYMQSMFQAGYSAVMRLKWEAEAIIRENGLFVENVVPFGQRDHLAALVARFPQIGVVSLEEDAETNVSWRNLQALQDMVILENFLFQVKFYVRFAKQCLDLSERAIASLGAQAAHPENAEDIDLTVLLLTAFAQYVLFKKVSCEPLTEEAAESFIKIVFMASIYADEPKVVQPDLLQAFRGVLLQTSLAWTAEDEELLDQLLKECMHHLESQLGEVRPPVEWQFTRVFLLKPPAGAKLHLDAE